MITRSIVGRFLILGILIVAVGVVAQAAMILSEGGKKAVKTASAAPVSTPAPLQQTDAPAGDPVRVVYPGPLGDSTARRPKLVDAAAASPLVAPAPQTTAKLAEAMSAPPTPTPAAPAPATVVATAQPDPSPPRAAQPAPAVAATAPEATPATPAPAGVEVASLGAAAPTADSASQASGVNINTASISALNSLGGGHIGESIAKHRPYRSVEELVKKRVLRRSVYDHIKNQIAAK